MAVIVSQALVQLGAVVSAHEYPLLLMLLMLVLRAGRLFVLEPILAAIPGTPISIATTTTTTSTITTSTINRTIDICP